MCVITILRIHSVVDFASESDMKQALEELDGKEFKGERIHLRENTQGGGSGYRRSEENGNGYHRSENGNGRQSSRSPDARKGEYEEQRMNVDSNDAAANGDNSGSRSPVESGW